MHIARMRIKGVPPFTKEVTLPFDERVNVFIGPNATGKTTILRTISCLLGAGKGDVWGPVVSMVKNGLVEIEDKNGMIVADVDDRQIESENRNLQSIPAIFLPASRFGGWPIEMDILTKGDDFQPYESVMEDIGPHPEWFDARILPNKMLHMDDDKINAVTGLVGLCAGYICGKTFPSTMLVPRSSDVEGPVRPPEEWLVGEIEVSDGQAIISSTRRLFQLSYGTKGVFLWILYLAIELASSYNFQDDWYKQPAILLIDEIENHLHPTWQRRVIHELLQHFPGLQIFATTHSPFVVAGLKAGQVHLLNRDEDEVITATTNEQNIIGWTADEILRTFMGVDDPTDDETAAAARELRQLRDEGPRQEPLDEEQRRERMRELRQLVDRDLLAGGPAAAQEELFEQQFAEALEKYRQSRNLNQENS